MNLIKNLFGRHASPHRATPSSYLWPGQSGTEYPYQVYPLHTDLKPLPGVYIYAKQLTQGDWSPIYLSQSRDLHQRLEGHINLQDAIDHGATHLHVHYGTAGPAARSHEESDLMHRWQPECNDVFQS